MRSLSRSVVAVAALMFSFLLLVATCMPEEPIELAQGLPTASREPTLAPSPTPPAGHTRPLRPSPSPAGLRDPDDLPLVTKTPLGYGDIAVPAGTTVIRWYVGLGSGTDTSQVLRAQEIVKEYNATNPDQIFIQLEVITSGEAYDVLASQIAAGTPPDIIGPAGMRDLTFAGADLLPLDELIARHGVDLAAYDEGALRVYRNERGEQIALPYALFPSFIYFNKDLFDAAGLAYPPQRFGELYEGQPWDMAALRALGMRLTLDASGKNATQPGFDATRIVQFGFVPQWSEHAVDEGSFFGPGQLIDDDGQATIPPSWREAWRWFYRARHVDHFMPDADYAESAEFGRGNVWSTGKVAMAWTHLWYTCCFTSEQVPSWDLAVVPSYNGTVTAKLHADTFAIMKATRHPDAAFKVYMFLLQNEELRQLYPALPASRAQQPPYFAALDAKFVPNEATWQVALDSLAYPDIPNHERALPNPLRVQDRLVEFDMLRRSGHVLNLDVEIDKLESDLSVLFRSAQPRDPAGPGQLDLPDELASALSAAPLAEPLAEWSIPGDFDSAVFSPDGTRLAYEGADNGVHFLDLGGGPASSVFGCHTDEVTALAFSPDGALLASGGKDHRICLWQAPTMTLLRVLTGHEAVVTALAFTPDSRMLISGSRDDTLRFWPTVDGALIRVVEQREPARIVVSPDGASFALLVRTNDRAAVQLRRLEDGAFLRALDKEPGYYAPGALAFTPEGGALALGRLQLSPLTIFGPLPAPPDSVGSDHQDEVLFEIERVYDLGVYSLAFSPDGTLLAAGTFYQSVNPIMVWDDQGSFRGVLSTNGSPAVALAFFQDGARVGAVTAQGLVRVWNIRG